MFSFHGFEGSIFALLAVQTVMLVATYFGEQEINWGTADEKRQGLIVSILMIQLVAVLGAVITSKLPSLSHPKARFVDSNHLLLNGH